MNVDVNYVNLCTDSSMLSDSKNQWNSLTMIKGGASHSAQYKHKTNNIVSVHYANEKNMKPAVILKKKKECSDYYVLI